MRKAFWALSFVMLATPAFAQNGCPTDVGAFIAAACPCDADSGGHAWKNHGQYVSCVVRHRNELRKQGCLDDAAKRTIAKCAARSTCGKEGFTLCCFYDTSATCDAGFCSNDSTVACTDASQCVTVTGPKKLKDEVCADRGGTSIGGGSVCQGCPATPPL